MVILLVSIRGKASKSYNNVNVHEGKMFLCGFKSQNASKDKI